MSDNIENMSNNNSSKLLWILRIIPVVAIAIAMIWGGVKIHKIEDRVMKMEKMAQNDSVRYHFDSIYNCHDSLPNISKDNFSKEIYSAAHDASESFVNQTGNLLTLFGIMMTIITTIICIVMPLMINREYKELAEKEIKDYKESIEKRIKDYKESIEKETKEYKNSIGKETKDYKDSIEKKIKEYKDSIEKKLKINEQSIEKQQKTIYEIQTYFKNDDIRRKEQKKKLETHFKSTNMFAFNMRQSIIKTTNDILSKIKYYEEFKKLDICTDYSERIVIINNMIEKGVTNSEIYYELGKLYSNNENYDKACDAFRDAVNNNPEFVEAYLEWANVLEMKKNLQDSWEKREKAIHLMSLTKRESVLNESKLQESQERQEQIEHKLLKPASDMETKKMIYVNNVAFKMILVKGGTFELGETLIKEENELQPYLKHKVLLYDYYIGETVVTQGLWNALMEDNPSKNKGGNLPVENVSWNDAEAFIERLNEQPEIKKQNITFRLPTSAEWEYAARGGHEHVQDTYLYSGNNNIDKVAWYEKNSELKTHPVKEKDPNQLGLYDMSGNVFEWCQDFWKGFVHYYDDDDTWVNPWCRNDVYGFGKICRGGGWGSSIDSCRITSVVNGHKSSAIGFRLVAQADTAQ